MSRYRNRFLASLPMPCPHSPAPPRRSPRTHGDTTACDRTKGWPPGALPGCSAARHRKRPDRWSLPPPPFPPPESDSLAHSCDSSSFPRRYSPSNEPVGHRNDLSLRVSVFRVIVRRSRSTRFPFLGPCLSQCTCFLGLIDNQNEPMLVVAIKNLDVHPRLRHAARQFAQLPRFVLFQPFLPGPRTESSIVLVSTTVANSPLRSLSAAK